MGCLRLVCNWGVVNCGVGLCECMNGWCTKL